MHTPAVQMDGAKHLLGLTEDEVLELIESGALSFAWNAALSGAGRRMVVVLRASIDFYRETLGAKRHELTDAQAFRLLLPPGHSKPFLSNGEIQRALNCGSEHVLNLFDAGELKKLPGSSIGRGPSGEALATLESFRRFIERRRLP